MVTVAFTLGGGVSGAVVAMLWCALAAVVLYVYRAFFFPFVAVSASAVVVRGALFRHEVPLSGVRSVEPDSSGLIIRRDDGPAVIASAVQKANGDRWRSRHTRADDVAEEIMRRAERSRG